MKPRIILFIIILTSLSLLGVVFTQLFWVEKAINLKEDQFNNSVRIALKSVLNQVLELKNDSVAWHKHCKGPYCYDSSQKGIVGHISPRVLDSLMDSEMGCMKLREDLPYGIYEIKTGKFIMGNYHGFENELRRSSHQQIVSCMANPGRYNLSIFFPAQKSLIFSQMLTMLVLSALFLFIVIGCFYYTIKILLIQKKLSEMKTDFINNMTHEFKTPISAVSLASEMLMRPKVKESPVKIDKYAQVIFDENCRLQNQVERILQIAIMDNGKLRLKHMEVNVAELIQSQMEHFSLRIKEKNGNLSFKSTAHQPVVIGDRMHLMNIVSNLLDNAVKYSADAPEVSIKLWNEEEKLKFSISDKGIGISKSDQKLIFKKLFRVHTGDVHDVKGFGLGLYYVKTIVDAHNGEIKLISELGKGSTFIVSLPLFNDQ